MAADGSVTLDWSKPLDGTGFVNYEIFYSANGTGPYTSVGTVNNYNQETFTHSGANALMGSRYYYLQMQTSSGTSPASDTLHTIFVYMTTADYENVVLNWNSIYDPPVTASNLHYQVWMEYPTGTWTLLDSTINLTYDYHFTSCNPQLDKVNFMLKLQDDVYGCYSVSNLAGDILANTSKPDIPVLDSVSIDAGGNSVIGWEPGIAPDISRYIIYRYIGGINDSIDNVAGNITSYTHIASDPCGKSLVYAIAAVDSCGNTSPGTFQNLQATVYLRPVRYNACNMSDSLSWTPYINFSPALGGYRIYYNENNGPLQLLATLSAGDTSYIHVGLSPNTSYSYFVRAFSQDGIKTSTSCTRQAITYNSPQPQYMYLRYASVDQNTVNLEFYTDTMASVQEYNILRSTDPAGPFTEIANIPPGGNDNITYTDPDAQTNTLSYYYQVSVRDSCGNVSTIANTARTILLQVQTTDAINTLSWNAYESWSGGIAGYRIYRRLDNAANPDLLISVDASTLTYSDNISSLAGTSNKVSYRIEAYEGSGNAYGFEESSWSNEALAKPAALIYMPNAMAPHGVNRTIKPVFVFADLQDYTFLIYNRWGQKIFETTNPDEAWDGRVSGKEVPGGVYVYLIRYRDFSGNLNEHKGNFVVIY